MKRTPKLLAESDAAGAPSTARAPRFPPSSMNRAPSVLEPDKAANKYPGFTSRLSAASPRNCCTPIVTIAATSRHPTLARDYGSIVKNSGICRGKDVVAADAQKRRNPGNDAPDRRGRRRAAAGKSAALPVALRLVQHRCNQIIRGTD